MVALLVDDGPVGRWCEEIVAQEALAAPHLVVAETLNVLRRLEAAGEIGSVAANLARESFSRLAIDLVPDRALEDRIWELRHNLTCYDAAYVAVAEVLRCPLATLDRKLAAAPGPRCRILLPA